MQRAWARERVAANLPRGLANSRARLQGEYADLSRIYKPGFPKMQQVQAQIDDLFAHIADFTKING